MPRKISPKTFDLIVSEEVTSQDYYTKYYVRGEWPGLKSGITVGIGYDLGYNTEDDIRRDWKSYLPASQVNVLCKYAGLTGADASKRLAAARREINVPWDAAIACFTEVTLPKWIKKVVDSLPNTDILNDECLGVLVSLAYNRGPAWNVQGEKYSEMRAIKQHMLDKQPERIPGELRSMKRLWKLKGLLKRRDREALIFEEGLKLPKQNPVGPVVSVPALDDLEVAAPKQETAKPWWRVW
jgi:hypothetical protein